MNLGLCLQSSCCVCGGGEVDMQVCTGACMCMSMWRPKVSFIFHSSGAVYLVFLRQGLSLKPLPPIPDMGRLASKP